MVKPIQVLLFDDYPLLRSGVQAVLARTPDLQFVAFVDHTADAAQQCSALQPDVLLFASRTGQTLDLAQLATLSQQFPRLKILLLLGKEQVDQVPAALRVGVVGALLKEDPEPLLALAIRSVHLGGTWFSPTVKLNAAPPSAEIPLDDRDRALLTLIARGWDTAAIAAELYLAPQTVRNNTSHLYRKLNVANRAEAIIWALDRAV